MRKMILGTDWWTDCDDAVALRLLAKAHKAGDITLLGIGINEEIHKKRHLLFQYVTSIK